jgi:hypothetical protein
MRACFRLKNHTWKRGYQADSLQNMNKNMLLYCLETYIFYSCFLDYIRLLSPLSILIFQSKTFFHTWKTCKIALSWKKNNVSRFENVKLVTLRKKNNYALLKIFNLLTCLHPIFTIFLTFVLFFVDQPPGNPIFKFGFSV